MYLVPVPATTQLYPAGNKTSAGVTGSVSGTIGLHSVATGVPYSAAGRFEVSLGAGLVAFVGMFLLV